MIRCVVFDFDGTLVDSNDIKRQTFFDIVGNWDSGGEVVAEVFARWPLADRYEKTRRIAEELCSRKLLPTHPSIEEWASRLASAYTAQCESAITQCAEMPGATEALDELSDKGILLFVNSATPVVPLRQLLQSRGWAHFFQAVYGAEASKADNLRDIALATATKPHEIVHVGDQYDDLHGADQFGCHFVAMAAYNSGPVSEQNDLVIKDLRELSGLITKIAKEAS
jgi:phosphoglycolate phosphatase